MIDPDATHWHEVHQFVQLADLAYWSPHSRHPDMADAERARADLLSIWPRNRYQVVECRVVPATGRDSE